LPGTASETAKLVEYLPLLAILDGDQIQEALAGWYERRLAETLATVAAGGSVLSLLGSVGRFIDGHLFIAPYVAIHSYFGRERQKARVLHRELFPEAAEPVKVGVFVDEMDQIHGVATLYRNLQARAEAAGDRSGLRFVQCGVGEGGAQTRLRAVATVPLPLYEGRSLGVPSFLDVLGHVAAEGYDLLHVAAPGPLGVAALIAGTTLGLPVIGAYHTEFGRYAGVLSGDAIVADLVEALVREFYQRCAAVVVSSRATAAALAARGYHVDRCAVLRNGVDTDLFRPDRRDEDWRAAVGGGRALLLYAGRVSREKELDRLAAGYLALRRRRADVHLVIAGDGPFRAELAARLGETATFTGYLRGEELARTYASGDLFVFPSTTDTLGRVVAEAQASGLPAIVFDQGGPAECLRPDQSGYVVPGDDDVTFWARVEHLLDAPRTRARMGAAARAFALTLSWEHVLAGLRELYADVAGVAGAPAPAADVADAEPAA
jgi:glycosyltransferase involved in cell wall biosynthesis